jgi:hypothetical protein
MDGVQFSSVSQTGYKEIVATTNQHEVQYSPPGSPSGNLYFRIKQTDAQGKITFSAIRTVNMNENAAAEFVIYPNPVERKISMQFDRSLTGNYIVEISNVAGQKVYNRTLTLNSNNNVQFELANRPPGGMYYIKMTDTKTRLSYSNKLIMR